MTHILAKICKTSLIGAFFVCQIATADTPQQVNSNAAESWQMPADVLPITNIGRWQKPVSNVGSSVEIIEFFSYTCSHCATLQPELSAWENRWLTQRPGAFVVTPVAVSWSPNMIVPQHVYFTLRALKRMDLHAEVFNDWARAPEHFDNDAAAASWAQDKGIAPSIWQSAYNSAAVKQDIRLAQQKFRQSELNGVPSLVVNGRYYIIPNPNMFTTLDAIVQHETTAKKHAQK